MVFPRYIVVEDNTGGVFYVARRRNTLPGQSPHYKQIARTSSAAVAELFVNALLNTKTPDPAAIEENTPNET